MEDPAVVRPCVTVLKKLNDQLYQGLKSEMQVTFVHLMQLQMRFLVQNNMSELYMIAHFVARNVV